VPPEVDGDPAESKNQVPGQPARWQDPPGKREGADPRFDQPVSAIKVGSHLAVADSHILSGYPPTRPTYEVLVVGA